MRILIAEDNEVNQMVISRILARSGYQSVLVNNGLEVLKKLETEEYDLILMDIQMPEMDGIKATRAIIEKYPSANRPVIIALTAETSSDERSKYKTAGMDDVLTKPINVDELLTLLKKIEFKIPAAKEKKYLLETKKKDEKITLDPMVLEEFRELMEEEDNRSIIEFITLFQKNVPIIIEQIENANNQSQIGILANLIHSLKGNCGQIGALKMSDLCVEFEEEIENKRSETYQVLITKLRKEYMSLDASLSDYLGRINHPIVF